MYKLLINNLGTTLYTLFYGIKVGEDKLGNIYYISKKKKKRKWVLYKNKKDPTIIPVNWQIWLTNEADNVFKSQMKYSWSKDREQNHTGTDRAYNPAEKIVESKKAKDLKYKKWTPNNNE